MKITLNNNRRLCVASLWIIICISLSISGVKAAPPAYLLGPEDVIEVAVRNHAELNRTFTILSDGKIVFPDIGEIMAAGKTPKELQIVLYKEFDKTLNNFDVTVSVKEIHSRRVRVIGGLKAPGVFDLKFDWKLLDLIAAGGGLTVKPGMLHGRIIRSKSQVITLNVADAIADPADRANISLEADDLILFDELEQVRKQVYVMGQANRIGIFDLEPTTTILSLLSSAGNPTERAALSKAYVLRGNKEFPLNLRTTLVSGKSDPEVRDFKLVAGDILFLPENEAKYAVMGEVGKSGYYSFPESGKVTVLQAYTLAGANNTGDIAHAGIIRYVNDKPDIIHVNIDQMLKKAQFATNITLQEGDILYVPSKKRGGFGWQDILAPISALNVLGLRFFGR